jgi:hypothetical protein
MNDPLRVLDEIEMAGDFEAMERARILSASAYTPELSTNAYTPAPAPVVVVRRSGGWFERLWRLVNR